MLPIIEKMKRKFVKLFTTSNNSNRNTSNDGANNSKLNSKWLKFISISLLIKEVFLNDLEDERKYCH